MISFFTGAGAGVAYGIALFLTGVLDTGVAGTLAGAGAFAGVIGFGAPPFGAAATGAAVIIVVAVFFAMVNVLSQS